MNKGNVLEYLMKLTPLDFVNNKSIIDTFSVDVLMYVAYIFFYCHDLEKVDSTLLCNVCVGIHGQREQNYNRDYTILEALTIEAIFYYLDKKITPAFYKDYKKLISVYSNYLKVNTDNYSLEEIKQNIFDKMKSNKNLEKLLIKHFRRNRNYFSVHVS